MVEPVPDIVPPDQVNAPLSVTFALPPNVPAERFSVGTPKLAPVLMLTVPPLTLTAPAPVMSAPLLSVCVPPVKFSVAPLASV